jgi:hypothetical protein
MDTVATDADAVLRKADLFFMGDSPVHKTMRLLAGRLSEEGIDYVVIGE